MGRAWPFLVARGRTRDYRTVLVPELLAGRGQHALLADALAIPDPDSGEHTLTLRLGDGTPLLITARAEVLTAATVGADPRDEHGRPLEFLYGVMQVSPAAAPDLDAARERALTSYRRFLADEEGFTFDIAPTVDPAPAADTAPAAEAAQPPPPMALRAAPVPPSRPDRPAPRRVMRIVAMAAATIAAVVVLIVVWRQWSEPPQQPSACATDQAAAITTTTPGAPPDCR